MASELFTPTEFDRATHSWEDINVILNENWDRLQTCDKRVKHAGNLVGRYIRESIADGYALYLIIRENKKTVRIRRITHVCPDEYRIPYWSDETTIGKSYAVKSLKARDYWGDLVEEE